MFIIGIDPGKTGAVATIDDKGSPVSGVRFTNWSDMDFYLRQLLKKSEHYIVGLEQIHAAGGNGSVSAFSFAKNCGGWEALLEIAAIKFEMVPVQSWQPKMLGRFEKGKSKEAALQLASSLYPGLNLTKKDQGTADALCIALHLKKKYVDNPSTTK